MQHCTGRRRSAVAQQKSNTIQAQFHAIVSAPHRSSCKRKAARTVWGTCMEVRGARIPRCRHLVPMQQSKAEYKSRWPIHLRVAVVEVHGTCSHPKESQYPTQFHPPRPRIQSQPSNAWVCGEPSKEEVTVEVMAVLITGGADAQSCEDQFEGAAAGSRAGQLQTAGS